MLLHKDASTPPHTSSGKPSQLHTNKQNKSLQFLLTVPLGKRFPAVLLRWLSHKCPIFCYSSTTSHMPAFLAVALSPCNTILAAYPQLPPAAESCKPTFTITLTQAVVKHGGRMPFRSSPQASRERHCTVGYCIPGASQKAEVVVTWLRLEPEGARRVGERRRLLKYC